MEALIASAFSTLIIFITVFSIIKILIIGLQRKEILRRQFFVFSGAVVFTGAMAAFLLPAGFAKLAGILLAN
ncbi:hypothetical protein B0H99_1122 [Planomicrobium soli]|uniref:Uncharacterized protein n=1 Tax=Planomicrobium soli TaxID=1176648 RepID=A0A2P8GAQ7_9BACL|nr:hypothetical protein [Planomicrobium soli]PSL31056.1 hypothetical protein B0H99_1122 [Planomicrobium soli]